MSEKYFQVSTDINLFFLIKKKTRFPDLKTAQSETSITQMPKPTGFSN